VARDLKSIFRWWRAAAVRDALFSIDESTPAFWSAPSPLLRPTNRQAWIHRCRKGRTGSAAAEPATEDLNRRWYEVTTGQVITDVQKRVRHPALRWMGATLDARALWLKTHPLLRSADSEFVDALSAQIFD